MCPLRFLLALATVLCAAIPAVAQDAALRLHFSFAELSQGTTVQDASGHGHDGVLEGVDQQLPEVVQTDYGPALRLQPDKGQGIRVQPAKDLDCPDALTVMAWIRPDETRRHLAIVANKGDRVEGRAASGYRLSVFWSRLFMELGLDDGTHVRLSTPEWSVTPGHWLHVAMTFDGRSMRLFLNATEAARRDLDQAHSLAPRNQAFTVGKFYWNDAYPFAGLIADLRIYSRPLSEEQIFREACDVL